MDRRRDRRLPSIDSDHGRSARDLRRRPRTISPADSALWSLYEDGEFRVFDDVEYTIEATKTDVSSAIVAPLGEQGLRITATESGGFSETETELFRILASATGSALSRTERKRELQRQNERLDQFTSVVSHDLKTPIQLAVTQLDLYRQSRADTHLDELEAAHNRMLALVDNLLTLARQGNTVDSTRAVSLATVAERAWGGIDAGGAQLQVAEDTVVEADPGRLDQLLTNLFTNAIEHGATSAGTRARRDTSEPQSDDPSTASALEEAVTVAVGSLADEQGFYVADDGPGIPPMDREQILERGYTTSDDGTGFGLAIVAEIVDAHGWSITVTDASETPEQGESAGRETVDSGAQFEISGVSSSGRMD